jgi:alkylation response protein AidB-like acyl-CoA dehydrogenase
MNFDRNDEQTAIAETARALLAARGAEGKLWPELCELGWPGIAVAEEHGGGGLGLTELTILIEEHGYACAATPLLGTTLAALAIGSCGSAGQGEELLPALASGQRLGALARSDRDELVPDAGADSLLVAASAESGEGWVYRSEGAQDCEAIDPRRRHGRLDASATGEPLPNDARPSLDQAAVVVAAELVGLCRRALDLTVGYIKERTQFGVPIGSFQAVQHGAVQMLRDTESAAVLVQYAAWTADNEPALAEEAAAMAKASASAAGRSVTAAAIQLHGGIGFTWEADLHWLFKRAQVDAAYLGSAAANRVALARRLARNVEVAA